MDDDVRDERGRVLDEAGVEGEDAVAAAVAPTAAHSAVTQRRLFAYPRATGGFHGDHRRQMQRALLLMEAAEGSGERRFIAGRGDEDVAFAADITRRIIREHQA